MSSSLDEIEFSKLKVSLTIFCYFQIISEKVSFNDTFTFF